MKKEAPNSKALNDVAYVCPQCGSANISTDRESSVLQTDAVEGIASCHNCGWTDKTTKLAAVTLGNPFGGKEQTLDAFASDVLTTTTKECILPIGQLLIRWGFIDGKKIDQRQFSRYIAAIAQATVQAIVETRRGIASHAKEKPNAAARK